MENAVRGAEIGRRLAPVQSSSSNGSIGCCASEDQKDRSREAKALPDPVVIRSDLIGTGSDGSTPRESSAIFGNLNHSRRTRRDEATSKRNILWGISVRLHGQTRTHTETEDKDPLINRSICLDAPTSIIHSSPRRTNSSVTQVEVH